MAVYRDKIKDRYIFDFKKRIHGKQFRIKKTLPKGWSKTEAEQFGLKEEARIYGIASGVIKEAPLISEAVLYYLQHHAIQLKTYRNLVGEFQLLESFFEGRRLDELDVVCAEYTKYALENKLSNRTIQARVGYLCTASKKAWKMKKGFYDKDPTTHVVKTKVNNQSQLYYTKTQVIQLARSTNDKIARRAILIGYYTGMRLEEICSAEVVHDHFLLKTSKNERPRNVPIHRKIKYISRNPVVMNRNRIQNVMKVIKKKLGLEDYCFHTLRHTAASAMVQNKVDLYTVGRVLGHKNLISTTRYAHLATENLADALSTIGTKR
jgi:integrase